MVMFWVALLAVSLLLYVLLNGFDLGVGILFGRTGNEERRHAMLSAVAPIWDGNETWLVVAGVILWGAFPLVSNIATRRSVCAGCGTPALPEDLSSPRSMRHFSPRFICRFC